MNAMPNRRTIAGMECLGRKDAADYIGCSTSKLDKIVALSRTKKAKI